MNYLYIYLIILIGILILLFLLYFVIINNKVASPSINPFQLAHENDPNFNWNPAVASGACNLYTFPQTQAAAPTTNLQIVTQLTPNNNLLGSCLDQDQLYLALSNRVCGVEGSNVDTCVGYDGKIYQSGEIETFYDYCDISYCENSIIAAIAFNFSYNKDSANGGFITPSPNFNPIAQCLTNNNGIANVEPCDIRNANQFFKISRVNPQNGTNNVNPNLSGQYMQVFSRESKTCLSVDNNNTIVFADCNTNNGYTWFLSPNIVRNTNTGNSITPQQIAYITTLEPYIRSNDIINFVTENAINSISGTSTPTLQPFSLDINQNNANFFNSQILDKRNYPILSGNYYLQPITPKYPNEIAANTNPPANTKINFAYYLWQPNTS